MDIVGAYRVDKADRVAASYVVEALMTSYVVEASYAVEALKVNVRAGR